MDRKLTPQPYKKLVAEITSLYEGARRALVEAYWAIGKRIVEVEQEGAIKAAYGTGLLQKLSEDLTKKLGQGFSERNLERMRSFFLNHSKSSAPTKLGWAHYVELMSLKNTKKRSYFEEKAAKEGWDTRQIRQLVRQESIRAEVAENLETLSAEREEPPQLLTPQKGMLYTYRILDPKTVQPKEEGLLLVDLGFSCYRDLDAVTSKTFKPFDIIESVKTADDQYKLLITEKKQDALYTYKGTVEKIVDGDTLRVVVDLGFNTRTRQYLRLRGLDCLEMDTPEGKKAAEFVRARIRQADEIILTSSKSDKYDRYLADVYFIDAKGQEVYLNNLLLESGLAVRVME